MDNSQTYNCMNPAFNGFQPQLSQEQNLVLQNTTIYEDIKSPTSIPSSDNTNTLNNFQAWPSQKIIITGINKKTKCCIATPICLVFILFLLLAGTAALAVLTYLEVRLLTMDANNMPVTSEQDLLKTVQNLEHQLAAMNVTYQTKIFELETIFDDKIQTIIEDMQMYNVSFTALAEVAGLTTELNETQGQLWHSIANLTARANTPLELYEGCNQERASCNQSGNGNITDYTRECSTQQVDANKAVSLLI